MTAIRLPTQRPTASQLRRSEPTLATRRRQRTGRCTGRLPVSTAIAEAPSTGTCVVLLVNLVVDTGSFCPGPVRRMLALTRISAQLVRGTDRRVGRARL